MSLQVYLHVHQCEDVVFDDVQKLNDDLVNNTLIRNLLEDVEGGNEPLSNLDGFVKYQSPSDIAFANISEGGYFEGYDSKYVDGDCFNKAEATVVANHMTNGKLVLRLEIEGNSTEFYICTPNNVVEKRLDDMKF